MNDKPTTERLNEIVNSFVSVNSLKEKEVININDGRKIGYISDIELDVNTGKVSAAIISTQNNIFGSISKKSLIRIYWEQIEKIGNDTILAGIRVNRADSDK